MATFAERLDAVSALLQQEQPTEAEALCRTLLRESWAQAEQALILDRLGQALHAQNRLTEARAAFEESLALLRVAVEPHPVLAAILQHLSRACVSLQDLEAAYAHGNEAVSLLVTLYGTEHVQVAAARFGLSFVAYNAKKYDEAEALSREAMRLWKLHSGPESYEISTCLNNLGRIYEERGDLAAGIAYHRQSVAMRKKLLGIHTETGFSLGNLGTALAAAGQWAEAVVVLTEAIACYEQSNRGSGYEVDGYRRNLAVCKQALGSSLPTDTPPMPGTSDNLDKNRLLDDIIERELSMFLAVPNEGGTASCQERPETFRLMRRMAHIVHTLPALASCLHDLQQAEADGRNVMIEKYARMDNRLPPLSASPLLDFIVDAELASLREAASLWPDVIKPHQDGGAHFACYLRAELETLSDRTLELYAQELRDAQRANRNLNVERYQFLLEQLGRGK